MYEDSPNKRNRKHDDIIDCGDTESDDDYKGIGLSVIAGPKMFNPITIIEEQKDPQSKSWKITAIILMSSGIVLNIWKFQVVNGGTALEIIVRWSNSLVNMKKLHNIWLKELLDTVMERFKSSTLDTLQLSVDCVKFFIT